MIDAVEHELAPLTRELRAYARAHAGCEALIERYYGIGELCAVTVVAERGLSLVRQRPRRGSLRRDGVATLLMFLWLMSRGSVSFAQV